MAHIVKAFHWKNGHLRVQERHFDSLDSARAFVYESDELDVFEAKIYDDSNTLVAATSSAATESYA
jgi:hypothetical protein